jgi:hypothetical protein
MSPILALLAFQGKPTHPSHTAAPVGNAPVTAREAREAFGRAATLLLKVNGRSLGASGIPAAERPVTRGEVVAEMARLYNAAEPTFRFIPIAAPYDPSKFRIDLGQRPSLTKLVVRGCVGRIAPLAVGPGPGLTPSQFGDALGFFMARLAQMSHLPSPEWTPSLQPG